MKQLMALGHASVCVDANTLCVTGKVDFEGAAALAEAGSDWLKSRSSGEEIILDLGAVEDVSSAALSMMLEWQRASHGAELVLREVRLSPVLAQLTCLSGLDTLIPVTCPSSS